MDELSGWNAQMLGRVMRRFLAIHIEKRNNQPTDEQISQITHDAR
jgi:hypothetical protein